MNYENLWVGDRVDYNETNPVNIIADVIRAVSTRSIKNIFNYKIASHTGVVTKMDGQYLVAGMRNKIHVESLEDKKIIAIARPKYFGMNWDNNTVPPTIEMLSVINKIHADIALAVRKSLEYDYSGIANDYLGLKWLGNKPKNFYCSEWYVFLTKDYLSYKNMPYSPYLLQKHEEFTYVWTKR
jgi:hypothetical protein